MRLLDILFYLLRSNSKVTVRQLSQEFNVSTKTIRRDLDKLSLAVGSGPEGFSDVPESNSSHPFHEHHYRKFLQLLLVLKLLCLLLSE